MPAVSRGSKKSNKRLRGESEVSALKGKIALMGSGELTPSMVEVHKELLQPGGGASKAFFLDTPAGFQPNVDDISRKAREFFKKSIMCDLSVASLKSADDVSEYDLRMLLRNLESAFYLLVGPGSPTYMTRQLQGGPVVKSMADIVKRGGCLAIASAAALTAGHKTLPVYEIYKVGMDLHWQNGLDLLGLFGLNMIVIPHWNNQEGGTHDTRFCYMGESRFDRLKGMLPAETLFLGIDEHTACVIDFENDICKIKGQGGVTLLEDNNRLCVEKGGFFDLDLLRLGIKKGSQQSAAQVTVKAEDPQEDKGQGFWPEVHRVQERFNSSLKQQNYKQAVNELLAFDDQLQKAALRFESEEDMTQTREIYRDLIIILGVELQQVQEKSHLFDALVDGIVNMRGEFKRRKMWDVADSVRNVLGDIGISLADSPTDSIWVLKKK